MIGDNIKKIRQQKVDRTGNTWDTAEIVCDMRRRMYEKVIVNLAAKRETEK